MHTEHKHANQQSKVFAGFLYPGVLHLRDFVKQEVLFVRLQPLPHSLNEDEAIRKENEHEHKPDAGNDISKSGQNTCTCNEAVNQDPQDRIRIIDLNECKNNKKCGKNEIEDFH